MKPRLLPAAEEELYDTAHNYAYQRRGLGRDFLQAVRQALDSIEEHPRLYGLVETLDSPLEVRQFLLRRFSYAIVYVILPDEILVIAIAHTRRRPNYWKRRLP